MGTRADFYIGKGKEGRWIGSITHDGYPSGLSDVLDSYSEEAFIKNVKKLDTFIDASKGWPWPWETSATTDYSYYWTQEGLIILHFFHPKYHNNVEDIPDYYGSGGLMNEVNITNAGFVLLGI